MPKDTNAGRSPVASIEWSNGINPYIEPDRKQLILDNRRKRAEQLEAWRPGAGREYLEVGLNQKV